MTINSKKILEICDKYSYTITDSQDVENVFCFLYSLISAEYDATKAAEPHATDYLRKLKEAASALSLLDDFVLYAMSDREEGRVF